MDNELRPLNKHDYLIHWGGCRHGSGSLALLARHLAGPGPPVLLLGGRPSIATALLAIEDAWAAVSWERTSMLAAREQRAQMETEDDTG
jgi:hypothetical protein